VSSELLWAVPLLIIGIAVGFALGVLWFRNATNTRIHNKESEARLIVEEARSQQKEILLQAKDEALRIRNEAELEIKESRQGLQKQEERLQRKEENIDRKLESLERRERQQQNKEKQTEQLHQEAERLKTQQVKELERIAALSSEEAREIILAKVEKESRDDSARRLREIEQDTKEQADKTARKIISQAIQRCASDYVAEVTVSTVNLPCE